MDNIIDKGNMAISNALLTLQYLLILRLCFLPKFPKLELNFDIDHCLIMKERIFKAQNSRISRNFIQVYAI